MGDRAATFGDERGFIMQVAKSVGIAGWIGLALAVVLIADASPAVAQDRSAAARMTAAAPTDMSAQARRDRRPVTRLRVERYQRLPPTAVRTCDAWYAQERRPSGTVIVPKMSCRWVNG